MDGKRAAEMAIPGVDPVSPTTLGAADQALVDLLESSSLFDAAWYLERYPPAAGSGLTPAAHYLLAGAALGHDPGPDFSTSRYLIMHSDVADAGMNPLVHFVLFGRAEGRAFRSAALAHARRPLRRAGRPCVLVVGHVAGDHLFGAERSLLDLLDGFIAIGFDVVVAVPTTDNQQYLDDLELRCSAVQMITRHPGWPRRPTPESAVAELEEVIRRHRVDAVHTNTVAPHEALLAARRCGIPAVLHAREIPFGDPALHEWLGLGCSTDIIDEALAEADFIIATSRATASVYSTLASTSVVPNIVDSHLFDDLPPGPSSHVRVALVGSATERKGLLELVAVAGMLAHRDDVSFVVVGPPSELTARLQTDGDLPRNVELAGYVQRPAQAMALADIVVNLSLCQESFARTILEAMASGLPVVAYAQGGTPEVIRDGETGFLVPVGDRAMVAERLVELLDNPTLRTTMGVAGRRLAIEQFSPDALAAALANSYRAILPGEGARRDSADDFAVSLPTENHSPYPEAFYVGSRARFAHCTTVRFIDENHLVTCSLLGREMHVVRLDLAGATGAIVSTITTTDGTDDVSVDLIDFDGDHHLVASNCERSSISLYRVEGDTISFERALEFDATRRYCHGVAFMPSRPGIVCAAMTTEVPAVHFVDTVGEAQIAPFVDDGWIPKSVTFAGTAMVVVSVRNNVGQAPHTRNAARVALVAVEAETGEHRILDTIEFPDTVMDGCHARGATVYVAEQANDAVRVFEVSGQRLIAGPVMEGFSFPHDASASPDGQWLAVANYGRNEVRVRRVGDAADPPTGTPTSPAQRSASALDQARSSQGRHQAGRGWWRRGRSDR